MSMTPQEYDKLLSFLTADVADSDRLDALIEGAELRVGRAYFGKAYVYALSLMVMHKAQLESMAAEGASGPVTQKREGDISVSYAAGDGSSGNGDLSSTTYGQEYLALLEQYSPRPGITGSGCCMGVM